MIQLTSTPAALAADLEAIADAHDELGIEATDANTLRWVAALLTERSTT